MKILIDEAVAKQALNFVEQVHEGEWPNTVSRDAVESALRQALADAEQPAQEPVAWGNFKEDGTLVGLSQHHEDQENWTGLRPLYTTPPAPAQPLNLKELVDVFNAGVSFAETARGIKKGN